LLDLHVLEELELVDDYSGLESGLRFETLAELHILCEDVVALGTMTGHLIVVVALEDVC